MTISYESMLVQARWKSGFPASDDMINRVS